ncbi:Calcineurin subunit B type 1 [Balamuthia mandrillaris]
MGNGCCHRTEISPELLEQVTQELKQKPMGNVFTQQEIRRLYRRFKKIDREDTDSISTDNFLSIAELSLNPLIMRLISLFDQRGDDNITFVEFVSTLSVFHPKAPIEEKMRFCFRIYDIDDSGHISQTEMFQVLKQVVGNNLDDAGLEQIVIKTFEEAGALEDDRLSFKAFCQLTSNVDWKSELTKRF